MTNRILRYSGLGLAVLTAGAIAACSSTDTVSPGTGGTTGSAGARTGGAGGATAAGGNNNTAGTTPGGAGTGTAGTGTAGTGGAASGNACVGDLPTAALITDFTGLVANAGQYTFTGGVVGGTFTYQTNALTLDTTGDALTVKGSIHDYDGFGVYFNTCYNAGAYTGVSFKIKGNAGAKGKLNFRVQTNGNTAVDNANKKGTCVPTVATNSYPDCHSAAFDIPVTATDNVVTVMFSQLAGGMPTDKVDGKDVVGLEWAFNWDPSAVGTGGASAGGATGTGGASGGSGGASAGAAGKAGSGAGGTTGAAGGGSTVAGAYDATITIDDITFVGGPPAGGAGGASAGGASSGGSGGSSAGSGGSSAGTGGKAGSGG